MRKEIETRITQLNIVARILWEMLSTRLEKSRNFIELNNKLANLIIDNKSDFILLYYLSKYKGNFICFDKKLNNIIFKFNTYPINELKIQQQDAELQNIIKENFSKEDQNLFEDVRKYLRQKLVNKIQTLSREYLKIIDNNCKFKWQKFDHLNSRLFQYFKVTEVTFVNNFLDTLAT